MLYGNNGSKCSISVQLCATNDLARNKSLHTGQLGTPLCDQSVFITALALSGRVVDEKAPATDQCKNLCGRYTSLAAEKLALI